MYASVCICMHAHKTMCFNEFNCEVAVLNGRNAHLAYPKAITKPVHVEGFKRFKNLKRVAKELGERAATNFGGYLGLKVVEHGLLLLLDVQYFQLNFIENFD